MKSAQDNGSHFSEEENLDLQKIFVKFYDKWLWFLVSVIICLIVAFFYTRYTPPVYQVNAKVLVNDDEKGGGIGKQAGALMDLGGILGGKNSVDNEVEILKTRFLMEQVVRQMQLNIVYTKKNNWVNREIYESPFRLSIINAVDTIKSTQISLSSLSGNGVTITGKNLEKTVKWGQNFELIGVGTVILSKNPGIEFKPREQFKISITSIDEKVAALMKQLSVEISNKQVTVIDLGLSYPVPRKGEDILNQLIRQYIASNLEEKNIIADSTTKFIQKRLSIIAGELGDVENQQKAYKQSNQLADISEQSKLLVQNTSSLTNELAKAVTQIVVLEDLESYLKDDRKNKRVFPASLVPQDMVFSALLNQYNSLLIERDKLLLSVTEESPFVKNIDDQIAELRKGILDNIKSTKNTFAVTRDNLKAQLNQTEGKISQVPQIEKDYLKLARNQQIKQELYVFLMQKAEETAISKTSNISIAKTIDPPKAAVFPISPKKSIIYLLGLICGILIPVSVVILLGLLNTTISSKEDIVNHTSAPIVGEISHNEFNDNLIVANQGRSAISEQFRALRTNLSFYLKNENQKVILLTSSMSGEGKSFTAINLGNILALAGKKVLLMELDLRKPGLSVKLGVSNEIGFSNYTINEKLKVQDIIKPLGINKNMFIVSSGPLPPNPAETLMSEYMPKLVDELKDIFDYIIMDAPPVGIITDAQLLEQYADITLYLVRQKVTKIDQLNIIENLYTSGKMKKLGIVVNDIVNKYYGYGYGYGAYGNAESQSKWRKFISKFN